MIAQLRICLCNIPDTFEELIIRFISSVPKGYRRIDIVADTYRRGSIESAEREKRGKSTKVILGSVKSKVLRDANKFMMNDENKVALINIIFKNMIENRVHVILQLDTQLIVLSSDGECVSLAPTSSFETVELKSK